MAEFFAQSSTRDHPLDDLLLSGSDVSAWLSCHTLPFVDVDGTDSESGSSTLSDPSSPAMTPCGSGDFSAYDLLSSSHASSSFAPAETPTLSSSASFSAASHDAASLPAMLPGLPGPLPAELLTPQLLHYYFTHYPHLFQIPKGGQSKAGGKRSRSDDESAGPPKRAKPVRPKVVEAKGAVQCIGRNRKKSIQCRNAALMEYIGNRPQYCAEHIELDPNSLYMKCRSSYQKEPGDNKGCKEVVLKEFRFCYKHYPDAIADMIRANEIGRIQRHAVRVEEIRAQLEHEAAVAKKVDSDLYQRKNKLIPKFNEMSKQVTRALEILRAQNVIRPNEFETRPAASLLHGSASSCSTVDLHASHSSCSTVASPLLTPTGDSWSDSDADFKSDFGSEAGTPRVNDFEPRELRVEDMLNFGADFLQAPPQSLPEAGSFVSFAPLGFGFTGPTSAFLSADARDPHGPVAIDLC